MSSDFIPFNCAGGFTILPATAIIYLDGEATTAQAMIPGEWGRVVIGGAVMEVQKHYIDKVQGALP